MLALSYLQTALTRGQADADRRAGATNLAERFIERSRGFSALTTTAGEFAFQDINETTLTTVIENLDPNVNGGVNTGNTVFTITPNVVNYRWNGTGFACYTNDPWGDNGNEPSGRCVEGDVPASVSTGPSDIKLLEMTVTWDGADFTGQQGTSIGNLGSETITVSSFINSVPTGASAKVQGTGDGPILPPIDFNPGAAPEIVRLGLGDDKFKESTLIEPNVVRGEIIETSWDVVTYSSTDAGAQFLRREEFVSVPCECTLVGEPADPVGKNPAVWAGDEYAIGAVTAKQYGQRVDRVGSDLCDRCCRDHHDKRASGAGAVDFTALYTPWRASSEYNAAGNHKHYRIDPDTGAFVEASVGETYLEYCRMVRVDGFWQVAQDIWSADRFVLPEDWLDEASEIATYSTYIVGATPEGTDADATADGAVELYTNAAKAVSSGYPTTRPCIGATCLDAGATTLKSPTFGGAYPLTLGAGSFPSWTSVTVDSGVDNQIRLRSLYVDYMSPDLLALVTCLQGVSDVDNLGASCQVAGEPGVGSVVLDKAVTANALEIIPFYETQLTKLSSWAENPVGQFASISNEPIADQNVHSRGVASAVELGDSGAVASVYVSNLGVLGSDRYVPNAVEPLVDVELDLRVVDVTGSDGGGGDPIPTNEPISGAFSRDSTVKGNLGVVITGENAFCSGDFATGWSCSVIEGASFARVKFSGYGKGGANAPDRWACAIGANTLTRNAELSSSAGDDPYSVFDLILDNTDPLTGFDIIIQQSSC